MNTLSLLSGTERLRPLVGNLIQTILARGSVDGSVPLGIVDENGSSTLSLRTIVRAMEVLNDFSKTRDFSTSPSSRVVHAYSVVERAINGELASRGRIGALQSGESDRDFDAGDDGSGIHVRSTDP